MTNYVEGGLSDLTLTGMEKSRADGPECGHDKGDPQDAECGKYGQEDDQIGEAGGGQARVCEQQKSNCLEAADTGHLLSQPNSTSD